MAAAEGPFSMVAGSSINQPLHLRAYGVFVQNFTAQYVQVAEVGFIPPNTSGSMALGGTTTATAQFASPPKVLQPAAVAGQTCFLTYTEESLPFVGGPTQSSSALASVIQLERFTRALLPAAGTTGRLALLTDYDRSIWKDTGTQWVSIEGETFNVKQFGAKGDGATNDGPAFQLAVNAAKVFGGRVIVPPASSFYSISTLINCNDIDTGVVIQGTTVEASGFPEVRWVGGPGSGSMMTFNSIHGVTVKGLQLTYSSITYDGDLISSAWSARNQDTIRLHFEDCNFNGVGTATLARSLLRLNKTIIGFVRGCRFNQAVVGIRIGDPDYVNVFNIEDNDFGMCSDVPILLNGGQQNITMIGNTFEPRQNLQCAAVRQTNLALFVWGFTYIGNWHGDASVNGSSWINDVNVLGAHIAGNYFGPTGGVAGATDVAIRLRGQGISIVGNRSECTHFIAWSSAVTLGVLVAGNDFGTGDIVNPLNANAVQSLIIANNAPGANIEHYPAGVTAGARSLVGETTVGVYVGRVSGLTAGITPAMVGYLDSGFGYGAGALGLIPGDAGGVNVPTVIYSGNPRTERLRVGAAINASGKFYPSLPTNAIQTGGALYMVAGVPSNTDGADGDWAMRTDVSVATARIYHKEVGVWVATAA